jgi:hypothetical protein
MLAQSRYNKYNRPFALVSFVYPTKKQNVLKTYLDNCL